MFFNNYLLKNNFYDGQFGISYTIFTLVLLAFYGLFISKSGCNKKYYYLGSGYIFLLSTIYMRSDLYLFKLLNFLAIPILVFVHLAIYTKKDEKKQFFQKILEQVFVPISKMGAFITLGARWNKMSKLHRDQMIKIIIGLVMVIPILLVIVPLMYRADAVFAHKMMNSTDGLHHLLGARGVTQIIIACLVGAYLYGQLCYAHQEQKPSSNHEDDKQAIRHGVDGDGYVFRGFDPTITATCLLVLDVLYLFFCSIQVIYLFGGASLPEGYSYAEYAREGFFQLLVLSMINGLIILIINKYYLGYREKEVGQNNREVFVSSLLSIMILCSFMLIISSGYRLHLYEIAYGSTRLRLLVWLFLVVALFSLGVIVYGIWHRSFSLSKGIIAVALVSYLIVNFVNIDGIVAKRNIDRYMTTGDIDAVYLQELSGDAFHQMQRLKAVEPIAYTKYMDSLRASGYARWQGFNISRYMVRRNQKD